MKSLHILISLSLMLLCCQAIDVNPNNKEINPFTDSMLVNEFEYDGVFSVERFTENNRVSWYNIRMRLHNDYAKKNATLRPFMARNFPPKDGFPLFTDGLNMFGNDMRDKSKEHILIPSYECFAKVNNMVVELNDFKFEYLTGNTTLRFTEQDFTNPAPFHPFTQKVLESGITWAIRNDLPKSLKENDAYTFKTIESMPFPDDVKLDLKKDVVQSSEGFKVNFPKTKNADAIYMVISGGSNQTVPDGPLNAYLEYAKGDVTSISLTPAESRFLRLERFSIVTHAIKFKAIEIDGKKFLFKNVAINMYQ